jgi:hypothetical protein
MVRSFSPSPNHQAGGPPEVGHLLNIVISVHTLQNHANVNVNASTCTVDDLQPLFSQFISFPLYILLPLFLSIELKISTPAAVELLLPL